MFFLKINKSIFIHNTLHSFTFIIFVYSNKYFITQPTNQQKNSLTILSYNKFKQFTTY